jgi:replication-associated recombination protein RarA
MPPHHSKDPWTRVTSVHGFPADELIAALQKSIRRGLLENSLLVAREMYETSAELEEHLWMRLSVISSEDAGDGSFSEPVVLNSLYEMHHRLDRSFGDRWLFVVHAVRFLVGRTKDRTTDELANLTVHKINGGVMPEFPDWTLDVHTKRGQEMGRTVEDFWNTHSYVENEKPGRDHQYLDQIRELLAAGEWKA